MDTQQKLRAHLLELLAGRGAHIELEKALKEFPLAEMNTRLENSPHTGWELLEHLRIAQADIVGFSRDINHVSPEFPAGYWNKKEGTEADWGKSVKQILDDLQAMRNLVADEKTDLFVELVNGNGQTVLREALLVADHNAYHLGELVLLMRILEKK